ncbi:Aldo/keto reductase [Polychaeton citri CBS 116435]|uniref:Aldo/keto reductase n=1 Tax=Polychaeton citri CBS 116435 TaxID=1314669 RepID=A0A9P4UNV4_9PEZI|nr:Aldo/keto reductase [Polychaeton citri CBS 116435]
MSATQKSALNVVFGAMTFGKAGVEQVRVSSLETASSILDAFQKHGHSEVDTARVYGQGSSETMLAELDWKSRGIVMDTKFYPTGAAATAPAGWDMSAKHTPEGLRHNLDKSLKALGTDSIDLWYLHSPDRTTPYDVTMKAVDQLYREGKFKRFGISNFQSWEVAQICELCISNGWKKPDVYQGVYNALHRSVEHELFPCLRKYGIAFYAFNPLAGGYLTSRYNREDQETEAGSRFDPNKWQGKMYRSRYWRDEYFDALDLLRPVAKQQGLTEAESALRWMNHHSQLKRENGDAIIIGASSLKHIEENMVDLEKGPLSDEVVNALDQGWEGCKGISIRYWH